MVDAVGPERRQDVEEGCLSDAQAVGSAHGQDAFATDASPDTAIGRLLEDNEPGTIAVDMPVLVVTGGDDRLVTPELGGELIDRMCAVGTDVTRHTIPAASHGALAAEVREPARQWLASLSTTAGASPVGPCGRSWP